MLAIVLLERVTVAPLIVGGILIILVAVDL